MLIENFYRTLATTSTNGTWTVNLKLNAEHDIFKGHFPETPVVPGVCLMLMIKESAEQIVGRKLQYSQVSSCKFVSVVNPIIDSEISFAITPTVADDGLLQLTAEGTASAGTFIKVKAKLIDSTL